MSKKGSGRGDEIPEEILDLARQQGDMASEIFQGSRGIRNPLLSGLANFMQTGQIPTALQGISSDALRGPARDAIEDQRIRAREGILSLTPSRGGQLNDQLAGVEMATAGNVSRLEADLMRNVEIPLRTALFNQGSNVAFGTPPQAIQGLGAAQSGLTSAQDLLNQQSAAAGEAKGAGAGLIFSGAEIGSSFGPAGAGIGAGAGLLAGLPGKF